MSGRFLAAPLLVSAILLIQYSAFNIPRWQWGTAVSLILLLGLASRHPTPFNNPSYGSRPEHEADIRDGDIADERMYYYPYTGLLNSNRQLHPWAEQGMDIRVNGPAVLEHGNIGFLGFYAGPLVHIVDRNGLADPLLARLPARDIQNWRIGHFRRNVPEGYTDGFWTGENHLVNPHLALYYEKLQRVVRGDLFNRQRWVEIWKLNTGQYNNWLKP
jgi:arabinofuranosyltransferase